MKKLRLELDELTVESFDTSAVDRGEGTVRGHDNLETRLSCRGDNSCLETGCDTCDNSLDYCTCRCSYECTDPCYPGHGPFSVDSCPCYQEP
jgi:hypothetical protein